MASKVREREWWNDSSFYYPGILCRFVCKQEDNDKMKNDGCNNAKWRFSSIFRFLKNRLIWLKSNSDYVRAKDTVHNFTQNCVGSSTVPCRQVSFIRSASSAFDSWNSLFFWQHQLEIFSRKPLFHNIQETHWMLVLLDTQFSFWYNWKIQRFYPDKKIYTKVSDDDESVCFTRWSRVFVVKKNKYTLCHQNLSKFRYFRFRHELVCN